MQRLELCEQGVGGISLRGEGKKGGREDYGFLCRMRAFFWFLYLLVKGFEVGDMEEIIVCM